MGRGSDDRIDSQWPQWAKKHPNLAQVIDRIRFVESTVEQLADDPQLKEAMRQANLDEARLAAVLRVVRLAELGIGRLLRL